MVSKLAHCLILAWLMLVFGADTARADEEIAAAGRPGAQPDIDHAFLPPRPAGKGLRRLATFGGGSDSTCIGYPKTPLCAVETLQAGKMRGDVVLFNIAAGTNLLAPPDMFDDLKPRAKRNPEIWDFRVAYEGPVTCRMVHRLADTRACPSADRLLVVSYRFCERFYPRASWYCDADIPESAKLYFLSSNNSFWYITDVMHVRR
ncbi:MAG: hypothetical protein ACKVSF_11175 [Alphaproteobacteria bacterium]